MEVVRDKADNCIIICSIENIDPMGVHTGDSITVAPALTLTDKEYQIMRNASIAVLREIGVETGGSNVQFAVNPEDGRLVVIEMNPRVSRSSALASKATGFPIAKIAAKLAVGYTLDELDNDITGGATPASFEPSIDYVVTKIPRFAFEKFPGAAPMLTTAMKSVGEVMAIGRTFQESPAEGAARPGNRPDRPRRDRDPRPRRSGDPTTATPSAPRSARRRRTACAWSPRRCAWACARRKSTMPARSTPGSSRQIKAIVDMEARIREHGLPDDAANLRMLKAMGFSDARLATLTKQDARRKSPNSRNRLDVRPVYKRIDTCAAEFASPTAYMYSTYETPFVGAARSRGRAFPTARRSSSSAAVRTASARASSSTIAAATPPSRSKDAGFEAIMINCNPETVSTDYDTSDRLYFEPLTAEDVIEILRVEQENGELLGVIVQFGGQTPLKLAEALWKRRHPDPRHRARHDRPRRGPRPLPEAPAEARPQPAEQRHRLFGRAGPPRRHRNRLPAGRAPLLRARRPRHADHPRRRPAADATCSTPCRNWCRRTSSSAIRTTRPARSTRCSARTRCCSTAIWPTPSKSTSTASPTARTSMSPASWSISRKPASIRATAPARCRRARCRAEIVDELERQTKAMARPSRSAA